MKSYSLTMTGIIANVIGGQNGERIVKGLIALLVSQDLRFAVTWEKRKLLDCQNRFFFPPPYTQDSPPENRVDIPRHDPQIPFNDGRTQVQQFHLVATIVLRT